MFKFFKKGANRFLGGIIIICIKIPSAASNVLGFFATQSIQRNQQSQAQRKRQFNVTLYIIVRIIKTKMKSAHFTGLEKEIEN